MPSDGIVGENTFAKLFG
ncbi:hypothetical protein [Peribacillus simplex]